MRVGRLNGWRIDARTALVVGASGGIGSSFVDALDAMDGVGRIFAASRRPVAAGSDKIVAVPADLTDETSIAALSDRLEGAELDLVVVATGVLHDEAMQPEKRLADIDAAQLARSFAVNSIGVALLLKHLLPLLARDRPSVFAALSARVGSIGDNRKGGWYGYRASKAALNMLIKTASIELVRLNPGAACIGLHPGTVDTNLSGPFQKHLRAEQIFSPDSAAAKLLTVIASVGPEQSGKCLAWDGTEVPA